MSYTTARTKLVELIEGTTPATIGLQGLPRTFVHDDRASDLLAPSPRRFYLAFSSGAGAGSEAAGFYTVGRRTRLKTVDVVIGYQRITNAALLDAAMGDDLDAISDSLLASENWDPTNSGIVAISQGGNTALPHSVEQLENDVILCRLQFGLEHY